MNTISVSLVFQDFTSKAKFNEHLEFKEFCYWSLYQFFLPISEQRDAHIMLKNNNKRKTNNQVQLLLQQLATELAKNRTSRIL